MNTTPEESTIQSDDTEGHRLAANVNEMVDSDDDSQGHRLAANVNETVDSDDAELKRPDEAVEDLEPDKHEADEVTGGISIPYQKIKIQY